MAVNIFMKTIKTTVPLLIRLLEYAREDSKSDMDLHFIVEFLSTREEPYAMKDYDDIIKSIPKKP